MTDLAPITNHVRLALLHLNGPFVGKPRIASLVKSLVLEVQALEDAIQSVITLRQIDYAGLEQLKILGKIVGQVYASEALETYRAYVRARILANRSGGTIGDLLGIVKLLSTGSVTWHLENTNQVAIAVAGDSVVSVPGLNTMLRDAKAANEGLYLYHSTVASASSLRFDRASSVSPATGGWGRASNSAIGGKAHRVRNR
jgi:hypothetical protein